MKNKILILLALFLLIIPAKSEAISVCECGKKKSAEEEKNLAFAIFTGKVKNVEPMLDGKRFKVDFEVVDSWKTVDNPTVSVFTEGNDKYYLTLGGVSCGYRFNEGQTYLVYSYRQSNITGPSYVSACGGTKLVSEAGNDLRILGTPIYSSGEKK